MKDKLLIGILTLVMAFSSNIAFADEPVTPGGDPDVPIDGGLSILLAAGVAYGAKKGYDQQKKKKNAEGSTDVTDK